ncbi:MAG: S8 family serine peptidase [candidate division KSB1 bacterium]|nr:S8 family serine peptidase [candidate division KSB1 bacterium]MDZ7312300.1 S8 family serine peptidase [candidate division KSB1 bacterium]
MISFLLNGVGGFAALPSQAPGHSPGELILKLRASAQLFKTNAGQYETGSRSLASTFRKFGAYVLAPALPENAPPELHQIVLVRFADSQRDVSAALVELNLHPEVEYVQLNHVFIPDCLHSSPAMENRGYAREGISALAGVPNDSLFPAQWALQTIRAPEAWRITTGSPEILIAVIDTGLDFTHPDLQTGIWINPGEDLNHNGVADSTDYNNRDDDGNGFVDDVRGWDFTDAPNFPDAGDYRHRDNDPTDENGHGTGITGIIAATTNNRIGIAGLAYNCRVMALRAGTSRGLLEEDDVASAIVYAVQNGARVINMSFGDVVVSPVLQEIIHFAHARGVVLIASAGNSATDVPHYPSGFAETIAVGASNKSDQLASFSNYGATVALVAPGVEIRTTTLGGNYGQFTGTSASAPLVSAAAGLLLSRSPNWNNEMVRAALTNSARDLGNRGWDHFYGAGRLDAAAVLQLEQVARAEIHFPNMDAGFAGGNLVVRGVAMGALVTGYELAYGIGDDPIEWSLISRTENRQVLADSLGVWSLTTLADTTYTLRLAVQQQNGRSVEDKIRIFIDRSPPHFGTVKMTPMIDGNRHSVLIEFATDDLCQAILNWRQRGSTGDYTALPLNYLTKTHRINFSQQLAHGEIEFFLEATNRAGLRQIENNNGENYLVNLNQPPVSTAPFVESTFQESGGVFDSLHTLPAGWLLAHASDFNNDGRGELILSVYGKNNSIGSLTIFERGELGFVKRFGTVHDGIPRDFGDGDGDGRAEILGGIGPNSFIYEATTPGAFPSVLAWADTNDFWASRYSDLDGDGRQEIIGRRGDRFEILENAGDNQYQFMDYLPNFTTGSNITGVPHCEIGDFDGDGHQEILFGDYDGDLYIYETAGDNRFVAAWSGSLPLMDSIDFIRAGDFDGDGRMDFAAGCHSDPELNFEHEFDARHWRFRIYRSVGDNHYAPIWEQAFFGFQSPKDFDAGLGAGDIDGDGRDELFLNLFPNCYVVKIENGEGKVIWHYQPVRSNTTVVANLDGIAPPEFYFSDGRILRAFQVPAAQTGASAPNEVEALPLDATSVLVTWRPVAGAEGYVIYRGTEVGPLHFLTSTRQIFFRDSLLTTEQFYRYAVATIDSQQAQIIGPRSSEVGARPSRPPVVVSATFFAPHHVALLFNEPMHESTKQTTLFVLNESDSAEHGRINISPESVALSRSGSEVILSFPQIVFTPGSYQVRVNGARDADRVPLDTTRNRAAFSVAKELPRFHIIAAELESPQQVLIRFNLPVDVVSAALITNYRIRNLGRKESNGIKLANAAVVTDDSTAVRLRLANAILGPVGRNYVIEISGVRSASGIPLRTGEGDAIAFIMASPNLDHVLIYPNPFLAHRHTMLTIAGLTPQAVVKILDVEGRVLITLEESDANGGLDWDTRDASGKRVPSGVYLCYVTSGTQTTITKFVIVR